jgi:hypothetical protein
VGDPADPEALPCGSVATELVGGRIPLETEDKVVVSAGLATLLDDEGATLPLETEDKVVVSAGLATLLDE